MPASPSDILRNLIGDVSLNILLFGPDVTRQSNDPDELALQNKRKDIHAALTSAGHHVTYAENIVEPGFPTSLPYSVAAREFDVIISYISSSTALTELDVIRSDPEIADRTMIFLDSREQDQVAGEMSVEAELQGAQVENYSFPEDIVQCNLLTASLRYVSDTQAKNLAI